MLASTLRPKSLGCYTYLPSNVLDPLWQVLEWTVGDSFDFAMVLCSFLLGAGYDAYVVYGTAPRYVRVCVCVCDVILRLLACLVFRTVLVL